MKPLKQVLLIPWFLAAVILSGCTREEPVEWIQTTGTDPWKELAGLVLKDKALPGSEPVILSAGALRQTIDGFGACFNELGWEALGRVSQSQKEAILRSFFDPLEGCGFTLCRMPVGANDYAVDWYSLNENPGDYEMVQFSIDRDQIRLIPYIRSALQINPGIRIWASPWSPPSWMKQNGHYACRSDPNVNDLSPEGQGEEMVTQLITDNRTLSAYALYFSRFIQAYREEGIQVYAVHVQNEPNSCQNFPSCIWRPEDLARFIGEYLGPRFESDGLDTEIWLGTIERPQIERVDAVLQDPLAASFIKGVGFQWAGKGVIAEVQKKYPSMKLMQTESECGDGSNDWAAMEYTFSLMEHYFAHGAESYLYWNMVLDETGRSQWGWKQNSLVTIGPAGDITYHPEYYLMRHLSAKVSKGARLIEMENGPGRCIAFLNPQGSMVVVVLNPEEEAKAFSFKAGDAGFLNVELPGRSLHTFTIPQ